MPSSSSPSHEKRFVERFFKRRTLAYVSIGVLIFGILCVAFGLVNIWMQPSSDSLVAENIEPIQEEADEAVYLSLSQTRRYHWDSVSSRIRPNASHYRGHRQCSANSGGRALCPKRPTW